MIYLRNMVLKRDKYPVPQYSAASTVIFYADTHLLNYCEENPGCEYLIYWGNSAKNPVFNQFTLQYTNDGKMILGLSIVGNVVDSEFGIALFKDVKKYLNAQIAYITDEEPPPGNSIEFSKFCNERFVPVE